MPTTTSDDQATLELGLLDPARLDPLLSTAAGGGTSPLANEATPSTWAGVPASTNDVAGSTDALPVGAAPSADTGSLSVESFDALSLIDKLAYLARLEGRIIDRLDKAGHSHEATALATAFLTAFLQHPRDFNQAVYDAWWNTVKGQAVEVWEYLVGVFRWALQMGVCAAEVDVLLDQGLDLEALALLKVGDGACAWVDDFIKELKTAVGALLTMSIQVEVWKLAVEEHPGLLLDALDAIYEAVYGILDHALADPQTYAWLKAQVDAAPTQLGTVCGTIFGFVTFQVLWALLGVLTGELGALGGEAATAGKVLWELANLPLPSLPSHSVDRSAPERRSVPTTLTRPTSVARQQPPAGQDRDVHMALAPASVVAGGLNADEVLATIARYREMLGPAGLRLLEEVVEAARGAQGSLTRCITDARLRAILKVIESGPELSQATKRLRGGVADGLKRSRRAFGPHEDIVRWLEHLNRGHNALAYLDLIAAGTRRLDRAQEVSQSVAMMTKVVDAAHALDQRGWSIMQPILNDYGIPWQNTDQIWSMILSQADHRGNALVALERSAGLPRGYLGSDRNEWKSLTGYLIEKIEFVKDLPSTPAKGVTYLHPGSTAKEIIETHRHVTLRWAGTQGKSFLSEFKPSCEAMYDAILAIPKGG